MRILLWAATFLATAAFAQNRPFDILNTYPEPNPAVKPRLLFLTPAPLPWDEILAAHSPGFDLNAIPKAQFDRLPKESIYIEGDKPAFDLCRLVPLAPQLQFSTYTLVSSFGLDPLQVTGMRVCATFYDEPVEAYGAKAYYGMLVAVLPAKRPRHLNGFVVRTDAAKTPVALPRETRQFTAAMTRPAAKLDCRYAEPGRPAIQATLEAGHRQGLDAWHTFRLDGTSYAFVSWRGDSSTCQHLYSLLQLSPNLPSLGEASDSCDP